jgi:hypothetical protein
VLVCSERRVLLAGCWWLICSERKVLLAGAKPSEHVRMKFSARAGRSGKRSVRGRKGTKQSGVPRRTVPVAPLRIVTVTCHQPTTPTGSRPDHSLLLGRPPPAQRPDHAPHHQLGPARRHLQVGQTPLQTKLFPPPHGSTSALENPIKISIPPPRAGGHAHHGPPRTWPALMVTLSRPHTHRHPGPTLSRPHASSSHARG